MRISIDDLIGTNEETMGVYQIILYLRFHPWYRINLFSHPFTTPSEILSVYFSTSSSEGLEKVKNTMIGFHNRFEEALEALDLEEKIQWIDSNRGLRSLGLEPPKKFRIPEDKKLWDIRLLAKISILEELEERYFKRFKEAFERYLKVDKNPMDYHIFVKKFLQLAHRRVIGEEFTRAGSAKISYNQILVVAEELRGRECEFIDNLRESRIAYRGPLSIIASLGVLSESQRNIIIPSVAVALFEEL
jgi:hypothetical protein